MNSNRAGIKEASLLPQVRDSLYEIFSRSTTGLWFFIWRPAVYLYIFLGTVAIASYRLGTSKIFLLTVPLLMNSLPMLLVVIHKSVFRYHYGLVLVACLFSLQLIYLDRSPCHKRVYGNPDG